MKTVALYIRVSSDKQVKDGDSIPAQLEALRKYADAHHYRVHAEYIDDGISGTKYSQRDELQRLLDSLDKIDIILFTKLDRWFRSVRHYTATQELLDKHGVGWIAIWEPIYDTTTPHGRLIVNQMMSIAQFEAENTGQRVRAVLAYKASKGEVISGSTPYGYSIRDKRLVPDEHADGAREIFRHYARTGNLHETARYALQFDGAPRSQNGLKSMLKNQKYMGTFRDNPAFCEALIDKALFEDVQRKLSINVKSSQKHTYIFSGLVKCADCGASMGANRRKRKRGNCITVEVGYRCPLHYCRADRTCHNSKMLNENVLERHLLAVLRPELEKHITNYEIKQKPHRDSEKTRRAIEGKLSRLKNLYVDGLIDMSEYRADREKLESELSAVADAPQKDLTELKRLLALPIGEIYQTFSREEKRFFWRSVIKEIRYGVDKHIDIIFA